MSNDGMYWWYGLRPEVRALLLDAEPEYSIPPEAMPATDDERDLWPELERKGGQWFLPEASAHRDVVELRLLRRRRDDAHRAKEEHVLPSDAGVVTTAYLDEADQLARAVEDADAAYRQKVLEIRNPWESGGV